ncbi:MAG: UDP-N-acetylglucosamine 2-epimerase (non-hydrolyzing) [Candidatus Riflebacteria bacterium]|nr:UDP-N-acetylglucosamine 2-epimerase (non-hydrolyzing) [Candidatus Riflebacteria bacterium]
MKLLTIVGARPQFIKAAVVSRAIASYNQTASNRIEEIIIHTGQHYDSNMSDIFFEEMDIPKPHYNLGVGSGNHGEQTSRMLIELEKLLIKEKPDMVLVYGDTNSTLAGALAASKLHIPIAHVEAGLRSFNRDMPEEINRIFTDHVSDILFCPTDTAVENLKNEGIPNKNIKSKVIKTGDVMLDAAVYYSKISTDKWLKENNLNAGNYILATVHRAENTDSAERLSNIIDALAKLSDNYYQVVFPMHPRTKNIIASDEKIKNKLKNSSIKVVQPIGYIDMITAEKNCRLIMTDSGGMQKEAFFHKKLCITLRTETEWVELVNSGWNGLTSLDSDKIIDSVEQMLKVDSSKLAYPDLFGDGRAGEQIVLKLADFINYTRC